ncbi:hypothetical protein QJQ45_015881 [Haematococcus lacustris]|nr:hypothetical protein QJQ45_015881 [Haematococcus lacustris]
MQRITLRSEQASSGFWERLVIALARHSEVYRVGQQRGGCHARRTCRVLEELGGRGALTYSTHNTRFAQHRGTATSSIQRAENARTTEGLPPHPRGCLNGELLFVSEKAIFAPPKAIRGGVPLCFPQFGMMGPMPSQHGFARNVAFSVVEQEPWRVKLALEYDGSSQPAFPHPFTLHIIISICDNHLLQELVVLNTGAGRLGFADMVLEAAVQGVHTAAGTSCSALLQSCPSPLTFTAALHTYIRVTDIHTAKVRGLSQGRYLDNLASLQQSTQEEEELGFSGEVDRVYLSTPNTIQVIDPSGKRIVTVSKEGFPDAIVWNPWIAKAASMADFGDEEYKVMICIEPAVAGSGPVTLEPGAEWQGKQDLAYQSSSA